MAAFFPFQPTAKGGAAGPTIIASIGAGSATSAAFTLDSTGQMNPSIQVTHMNPSAAPVVAYVRLTVEGTSIVATNTDVPIVADASIATVRLFANPNPTGKTNIAVVVTVTPSSAGQLYFTPGQGGI